MDSTGRYLINSLMRMGTEIDTLSLTASSGYLPQDCHCRMGAPSRKTLNRENIRRRLISTVDPTSKDSKARVCSFGCVNCARTMTKPRTLATSTALSSVSTGPGGILPFGTPIIFPALLQPYSTIFPMKAPSDAQYHLGFRGRNSLPTSVSEVPRAVFLYLPIVLTRWGSLRGENVTGSEVVCRKRKRATEPGLSVQREGKCPEIGKQVEKRAQIC
jgi:hypothetical protein